MVLHVAAATAEFQVQKSVILLRDSGNDVSGVATGVNCICLDSRFQLPGVRAFLRSP